MAEKILIIDDDPETIQYLNLILARQGYKTLSAPNGMQALSLAHSEHPDLIVLDIMMPGMDGFEVARSLRRHPETALVPILMFTAKTQMEDKLAGYEAGVDIYLTKPIHPVELQANIKSLLAQRRGRSITLAKQGYIVGVMGAKGGLGGSTIALNLALAYHKKKNVNVIAAELRPGQGTWADELNLPTPNGLCNLLRLSQTEVTLAAVDEQLTPTPYGIHLLLANDLCIDVDHLVAVPQLQAAIEHLSSMAKLVILDIGTSFQPAYGVVSSMCDEMIVVTEPQLLAIKRTRALMDELKHKHFGSSKVLTIVTLNHTKADMTLPVSQIEKMLGHSVTLGFPPATEIAFHSAERNIPLSLVQPDGIIAQQFNLLADHLERHIAG